MKSSFLFPVARCLAFALAGGLVGGLLAVGCVPSDSSTEGSPEAAAEPSDVGATDEPGANFARAAVSFEAQDPGFEELFADGPELEILADGFTWSEGPVWIPSGGFLLFSDVPEDTIYRWSEANGLEPWIRPSGHTTNQPRGREPGSNGLVLDADGRLLLCQHGDRRVAALQDAASGPFLEQPAPFETIIDHIDGRRFNSPNDLVVHPDGSIYFTDPPYGLIDEDAREIEHHGIYRVSDGQVSLLHAELSRPNGIVLSPDGKTLYVANSDPQQALWMSWSVLEDGTLGDGRVLLDATPQVSDERPGLPDGMAVDVEGRVYATGPGGLWVFGADGGHLGTVRLPNPTANVTFGDDGSLYLTSDHQLLRLKTRTTGLGFAG